MDMERFLWNKKKYWPRNDMGHQNFNRKQCVRALLKLGFHFANKSFGKHDKFTAPVSCNPPFIMIPRHK